MTVHDSLMGERHLCAKCARALGYMDDSEDVERAAERNSIMAGEDRVARRLDD